MVMGPRARSWICQGLGRGKCPQRTNGVHNKVSTQNRPQTTNFAALNDHLDQFGLFFYLLDLTFLSMYETWTFIYDTRYSCTHRIFKLVLTVLIGMVNEMGKLSIYTYKSEIKSFNKRLDALQENTERIVA